jgi:hypothetical protein
MILERLLSSKTRVEILCLLFSNPDGRYYVRQIARELGRDIPESRVDNLDKAGSQRKSKLVLHGQKPSAIYADQPSCEDRRENWGSLTALSGLRQAWLYSMNSHPPGEGSGPVPVLIVGRVDLTDLNEAVTQLETKLGREINYTVFDETEFQRRRAEADPFLTEVFGGRNVLLIGRDDGV